MITKQLKKFLLDKSDASDLNFIKLIELLENSDIEFIDEPLHGIFGLATFNKAFYNIDDLDYLDYRMLYFIILHEYCHVLRVNKIGKGGMIKNLSTDNYEGLVNHILEEEYVADRYACFIYYKLNNEIFPRYRTQQLDKKRYRDEYEKGIKDLFGVIKDDRTYDKLLYSFLVNKWVDIEDEQPIWYSNVELMVNGKIRQNWHRLSDGDSVYYGSLQTNKIIPSEEVSHWRQLKTK